jgi:hypothetical protein
MKTLLMILATIMVFAMVPAISYGQAYQTDNGSPPISQPLVREGTVALRLAEALTLGKTTSEAEAESLLSSAGISPRNGWIADYPVTPDIAAEIGDAVADAAASGSLTMDRDMALAAYDSVMSQYNLAMRPDTSGETTDALAAESYSDPSALNNYYAEQGPPVVTYYAPPVAYVNLYSWVPYPFWWWNVRFPGFFVLADFHRPFFFHGHLFFVSNHFFDRDHRRFRRIDADDRFREFHHRRFDDHGRHFVNSRVVGPSEVGRGAEKTFKAKHDRGGFDADRNRTNFSGNREIRSSGREINRDHRTSVSSTGKKFNSSGGRGDPVVAPLERGRTFDSSRVSAPSRGGRMTSPAVQKDFSPSMRGGSMGGSFGGRHGRM